MKKTKKLLSFALLICMLFSITTGHDFNVYASSSISVPAVEGNITISKLTFDYANKVNSFLSDSRWKNGISWKQIDPKLSSYQSKGCCAYVADFAKYVYNSDNPNGKSSHTKVPDIKSGDILKFSNHYIVVVKRNGNQLITAEGAYANKVRVSNSTYTINGNSIYQNGAFYSSSVRVAHYNEVDDTSSSKVKVTFNANGGTSSVSSLSVNSGGTIGSNMPSANREGYAFDGWYSSVSGGTKYTNSTIINSNITLYAHWTEIFKITYSSNGGSGAPSTQSFRKGNELKLSSIKPEISTKYTVSYETNGGTLPIDCKTDYSKYFDYWYDSSGNKYYPSNIYNFTSSKTLYAHYAFEKFENPVPTKSGYHFAGWYDSNEYSTLGFPVGNYYKETNDISTNIILYADWIESNEILFGDVNRDGKISLSDVTKTNKFISGEKTLSSEEIFLLDVNIDGVITEEKDAEGNLVSNSNSDLNLLYQCVRNKIDYGTLPAVRNFEDISVAKYPKQVFMYGESFDDSGLTVQSNYNNSDVHHYWDTNLKTSGYDPYQIGEQTITVNYYQNTTTYKITVLAPEHYMYFDANGGDVEISQTKRIYAKSEYGNLPIPNRVNYNFVGWFTEAVGGTEITENTICPDTEDKTVYAHWEQTIRKIKFEGLETEKDVPSGTIIELPQINTLNNCKKCIGWGFEKYSDTILPIGSTFLISEDTILYPQWEEIATGHDYDEFLNVDNDNLIYKCLKCNNEFSVSSDKVLEMWNNNVINVSAEECPALDVVLDGIINAKDYAKLKNIQNFGY